VVRSNATNTGTILKVKRRSRDLDALGIYLERERICRSNRIRRKKRKQKPRRKRKKRKRKNRPQAGTGKRKVTL
jgi:hypothetical protein